MSKQIPLHRENYVFNKKDNSGESLSLSISFFDNGDFKYGLNRGLYYNQELTLQSYGNSATFNLAGAVFTPENLRELADTIEKGMKIATDTAHKLKKTE